ncbi:MAG: hypothetical protein R2695_15930 [Acidimicrobiales bacterium]
MFDVVQLDQAEWAAAHEIGQLEAGVDSGRAEEGAETARRDELRGGRHRLPSALIDATWSSRSRIPHQVTRNGPPHDPALDDIFDVPGTRSTNWIGTSVTVPPLCNTRCAI